MCNPRCPLTVPCELLGQLVIQQWFAPSWISELPTTRSPRWLLAQQDTGRQAVPPRVPGHGSLLLLLQVTARSPGSKESSLVFSSKQLPLQFALSLYTELCPHWPFPSSWKQGMKFHCIYNSLTEYCINFSYIQGKYKPLHPLPINIPCLLYSVKYKYTCFL